MMQPNTLQVLQVQRENTTTKDMMTVKALKEEDDTIVPVQRGMEAAAQRKRDMIVKALKERKEGTTAGAPMKEGDDTKTRVQKRGEGDMTVKALKERTEEAKAQREEEGRIARVQKRGEEDMTVKAPIGREDMTANLPILLERESMLFIDPCLVFHGKSTISMTRFCLFVKYKSNKKKEQKQEEKDSQHKIWLSYLQFFLHVHRFVFESFFLW
jgi:hypothetical protein